MRSVHPYLFVLTLAVLSLGSCVPAGKYKSMQQQAQKSDSLYTSTLNSLKTCQDVNADLIKQKTDIQNQMNDLNQRFTTVQANNADLQKQLTALSSISSTQAESMKKALENIGSKDTYIQQLRGAVVHRDSVNMAVLLELKAALGGLGDDAVIKVDSGMVSVDLSDKLLFSGDSSSYALSYKAKSVLGKLARVLTDQPDLTFMVEGNTDSTWKKQAILEDNWDLSVKRATAVVRVLQNDYNISPVRMTAAGHGEYLLAAPNDTPEGRAANRRTRITILPQLDPLIKLLQHQ
ncbi:OmpA/MotB family protein [Puia dinghuensis]|uniref:Flagellar motor protein MotB n=1 Tax=Puia dinghuensis TaxID=1792502 RepID=A0A8J2UD10_9BACT|nr:OmpA family protein [Puia dinghuensis]GGB00933.1 flagellar motor protein MotB [Puia dinghuensis]